MFSRVSVLSEPEWFCRIQGDSWPPPVSCLFLQKMLPLTPFRPVHKQIKTLEVATRGQQRV